MFYFIFPYFVGERKFVEAYPIHEGYISDLINIVPKYRLITYKPSRNQARKFAYKVWINPSGKGYNRFPFSIPSENYSQYHKRNGESTC